MSGKKMETKPDTIMVHETVMESWLRDAGTVVAALALILPGVWLGSSVLELIGGFILIVLTVSRSSKAMRDRRMSIPEARAYLDRLERGEGDA